MNITHARLIEDWTADILKKYMRLTCMPLPLPVPLRDIAERLFGLRCDVENLRGRLKSASGVLVSDKRWVILNKNQPATRLRYTLAHELAHWLIDYEDFEQGDHGLEHISVLRCKDRHERERRAEHVASALLMPKDLVLSNVVRYTDIGDGELSAIAATFGVSQQAMRVRLEQLQDDLRRFRVPLLSAQQDSQTVALHHAPLSRAKSGPRAAMVRASYPVLDHALYPIGAKLTYKWATLSAR